MKAGTLEEKNTHFDELQKMPDECCLDTWTAKCPAMGNPKYALSNGGLFNDFKYTNYPYMLIDIGGGIFEMDLFCGARYTDDPSEATQKKAAEMARVACDDMGELCGGFSVGSDPECCGHHGCTETVFLKPGVTPDLIDGTPKSMKTNTLPVNYHTWIKQ